MQFIIEHRIGLDYFHFTLTQQPVQWRHFTA